MRIFLTLVILGSLFGTASCSTHSKKSKAENERDFSGEKILLMEGSDLTLDKESVEGRGRFIFKQPLGEIDSNKNFTFQVKLGETGSLKLISYAGPDLSGGVVLSLEIIEKSLQILLETSSGTSLKRFPNIDPSNELSLSVDVHNSENPVHLLVWDSLEAARSEESAIFNSDADAQAQGRGAGSYWGFDLNSALVKSPKISEAVFGH